MDGKASSSRPANLTLSLYGLEFELLQEPFKDLFLVSDSGPSDLRQKL